MGDYKSAEFLGHLIRGMAEGVIFIDDQNITRLCNPVGGSIRGVKGSDIVGKPFLDCHPTRVYKKVLGVIDELKQEGEREINRIVKIRGRFYEHSYSAVRDSNKNYLGIVAVSRDITPRVLLEKQLKEYTKKLERSNHLKDLFADIMSHDFLNPVSIIDNFSEMILEEEIPAKIKEDVQTIKRNSERLIEMIENAKTYSKLEDSKGTAFFERNLEEILQKSIDEFSYLIKEKEIEIELKASGNYPAIVNPFIGDVFWNLISNAIKYSPKRSKIIIDISDEGSKYLISVADEADRIPEKFRSSVFDRFKRVGKESVKGSGLGLAIVKRIIDLHQGAVWVDENPEGGNKFYVEIPKKQIA